MEAPTIWKAKDTILRFTERLGIFMLSYHSDFVSLRENIVSVFSQIFYASCLKHLKVFGSFYHVPDSWLSIFLPPFSLSPFFFPSPSSLFPSTDNYLCLVKGGLVECGYLKSAISYKIPLVISNSSPRKFHLAY